MSPNRKVRRWRYAWWLNRASIASRRGPDSGIDRIDRAKLSRSRAASRHSVVWESSVPSATVDRNGSISESANCNRSMREAARTCSSSSRSTLSACWWNSRAAMLPPANRCIDQNNTKSGAMFNNVMALVGSADSKSAARGPIAMRSPTTPHAHTNMSQISFCAVAATTAIATSPGV